MDLLSHFPELALASGGAHFLLQVLSNSERKNTRKHNYQLAVSRVIFVASSFRFFNVSLVLKIIAPLLNSTGSIRESKNESRISENHQQSIPCNCYAIAVQYNTSASSK